MTVKEQYHQRIERKELDHPLIVLDLFSGIGTAAVVLKKLKLPIAKMSKLAAKFPHLAASSLSSEPFLRCENAPYFALNLHT